MPLNERSPSLAYSSFVTLVTLRNTVQVNGSYDVAEGSTINAIGMGKENGYAHVSAGQSFKLVDSLNGQQSLPDKNSYTGTYGDLKGEIVYQDSDMCLLFNEEQTGDTFYVLKGTDLQTVQAAIEAGKETVVVLSDLMMNTNVSVNELTVTDAGALHFSTDLPCGMDNKLVLEDGAQMIFDLTPSQTLAPLLQYKGSSFEQHGLTFIDVIVLENWDPDTRNTYAVATGLGPMDDVCINVRPADELIQLVGEAFIQGGVLYYGFRMDPVPDPATATLSLLALTALLSRRRRAK